MRAPPRKVPPRRAAEPPVTEVASPLSVAAKGGPEAQLERLVALAGNPNVGKTTIFNRLTGLRQKTGNYAGVTVERKSGSLTGPDGLPVSIVDVPGTYSLNPQSLDEEVAYRVLIGAIEGARRPDLVVCIVDASNLERNLYLASQVLDLGEPTIIALNMVDSAEAMGVHVDAEALSAALGVPVIPMVAARGEGVDALRAAICGPLPAPARRGWSLEPRVEEKVAVLARRLEIDLPELLATQRWSDALRALTQRGASFFEVHHTPSFWSEVQQERAELEAAGVNAEQAEIVGRYQWIGMLGGQVVSRSAEPPTTTSDRIDAVLTHRIFGPIFFFLILGVIFQSVFAWATPFMDWIDGVVSSLGAWAGSGLPAGPVRGLLVDGAAFIMDRIMKCVGLSGRSVVPMLSGFACAIPGIMATRTIDNQRDRLVTIMVIPLMTCSARLPVYTLLIGAFIPAGALFGVLGYQGLTLLALYLLGILLAIGAAWVLKRFVVRGERSVFVMELPPYRMPRMRDVLWRMVERSKLFLTRAGTIIFAVAIVLWFLAAYPQAGPKPGIEARKSEIVQLEQQATDPARAATLAQGLAVLDDEQAAYALSQSAVGRLGHFIEPALAPLGFDWKIGIALIASLAAREVAVSALATIYSMQDADETSHRLADRLRSDIDPRTGEPVFTPLVAVSMMVFFVIACQCLATVAVVKRETGSWRWPAFMFAYMTTLAWLATFATRQVGLLLGFT